MIQQIFVPFILSLILFSTQLQANLPIKLSLNFRQGMKKGLVLTSELHKLETISHKKSINMIMKNGIGTKLNVDIIGREKNDLNSWILSFSGIIFDKHSRPIKKFEKIVFDLNKDQSIKVSHSLEDQLYELVITPQLP